MEFYGKLVSQSKFLFILDSFRSQFMLGPVCVYACISIHVSILYVCRVLASILCECTVPIMPWADT